MVAFYLQPAEIPAQEALDIWNHEASSMRHHNICKVHLTRININNYARVPTGKKEFERKVRNRAFAK